VSPADEITVAAYRLGSQFSRFLPQAAWGPTTALLGGLASAGSAEKRSMFERHLRRVLGPGASKRELRRLSAESFRWYSRYYVESFRLPHLSAKQVDAGFLADGYDQIPVALESGNGCILALPHLGGWEWAGRWMTDRGHEMTVVVEPLSPPDLFDWFRDLREALGMHVVALGPDAGSTVIKALKNNHVVCLLCDRDLQRNGVEVNFFGERTTLPAGVATVALRTGTTVFPTAVYYGGVRGHQAWVKPPLDLTRTGKLRDDVQRVTQALAIELEELIRREPSQWHLFQPNWPSDPGY
jgi:phosphatidylinositol dimannoside acyltransferase